MYQEVNFMVLKIYQEENIKHLWLYDFHMWTFWIQIQFNSIQYKMVLKWVYYCKQDRSCPYWGPCNPWATFTLFVLGWTL